MSRIDEIGLVRKGYLAAKQAANNKLSKISGRADARADETAAIRDMVYRWEQWSQRNRQSATPAGVLEFFRQVYGERAFGFAAQELVKAKLISNTVVAQSPEAQQAQADAAEARAKAAEKIEADAKAAKAATLDANDVPDYDNATEMQRIWKELSTTQRKIAAKNLEIEGNDLVALSHYINFLADVAATAEVQHNTDLGKSATALRKAAFNDLAQLAKHNPLFAKALDSLDVNKRLDAKIVATKEIRTPTTSESHNGFIRRDARTERIIETILIAEDEPPAKAVKLNNKQLYALFSTVTPIFIQDNIIELNGGGGEQGGGAAQGAGDDGEDHGKAKGGSEPQTKKPAGDAAYASIEDGLSKTTGGWGDIAPSAVKDALQQARKMSDNFQGFEAQISGYEQQLKTLFGNPKMLFWLLARNAK